MWHFSFSMFPSHRMALSESIHVLQMALFHYSLMWLQVMSCIMCASSSSVLHNRGHLVVASMSWLHCDSNERGVHVSFQAIFFLWIYAWVGLQSVFNFIFSFLKEPPHALFSTIFSCILHSANSSGGFPSFPHTLQHLLFLDFWDNHSDQIGVSHCSFCLHFFNN